ncbi:hypothetical protein T492DRAFT_835512 [Pavlovales sp. CCMP2436]|nr:hypothetical protein T492DRAFT_835512 [Pavlovales sp. CCMP2436]
MLTHSLLPFLTSCGATSAFRFLVARTGQNKDRAQRKQTSESTEEKEGKERRARSTFFVRSTFLPAVAAVRRHQKELTGDGMAMTAAAEHAQGGDCPTPSAAASAPSTSTTSSCRGYICSHCKMRAASRKVSAQATLAAAHAVAMAFGLRPEEEVEK